jgi:hypothetical protein
MANTHHHHDTLNSLFFKDLIDIYPSSERAYRCSSISDLDFAKLGILRCISHAKTGQEFLQHHADQGEADIDPGHFFKALKSARRLANITSLNSLLLPVMRGRCNDPFADFEELGDFDIYAADGHYQHAAAHDPKRGNDGGQTIATAHFFRLDLRSHHLGYIALGEPAVGKKKTHDITVIKRATTETLRNGAEKGRKVIYAWDKACIDYHLWHTLKHNSGIYFITIEKSNSAAEVRSRNLIDPADPRNEGISGDHLVGNSNGATLRRISYTDPRDGTHYTYLTNELTLPAYQLVIIYKCRWDIEKAFGELKGKMEERKSWASSPEAKRAHGQFECLAHNLTLLVEWEMKALGYEDEVEMKKGATRGKTRSNREGKPMAAAANFIGKAVVRATQRTVRFIRWLRGHIYSEAPLRVSAVRLAAVWTC